MSKRNLARGVCVALLALVMTALFPPSIDATHSYSGHWRRTSSAVRYIPVLRMVSSLWVTRYNTAISDWRNAAMTKIRPYTYRTYGQNPSCPYYTGYITVCNGYYGATGWGGLALLWRDGYGHAVWGRAWQNDYYFGTGTTATHVAWRQFVICQEIGHNFGLGHVNEITTNRNTGSCMDYTNDPDGGAGGYPGDPNNMHPNSHDYSWVNTRHNHVGSLIPGFGPDLDTQAMSQTMSQFDVKKLSSFGRRVFQAQDGNAERYELDGPRGALLTTWVIKTPKLN